MDFAPGPIASTGYSAVELADELREFVRGQLTNCGLALGNAIVSRLPDLAGTYYAIVPTGTTRARALEHRSGWPAARRTDNPRWSGPIGVESKLAATTVIVGLIEAKGRGFAIGEDYYPDPADPRFTPDPTTLAAYGRAYQWSGTGDISFDTVHEVVRLADAHWVSNIVVAVPPDTEANIDPIITSEEIVDYAASHTAAVLTGAYDGEGYVLWFPAVRARGAVR